MDDWGIGVTQVEHEWGCRVLRVHRLWGQRFKGSRGNKEYRFFKWDFKDDMVV
jgi:hypothetical protein